MVEESSKSDTLTSEYSFSDKSLNSSQHCPNFVARIEKHERNNKHLPPVFQRDDNIDCPYDEVFTNSNFVKNLERIHSSQLKKTSAFAK